MTRHERTAWAARDGTRPPVRRDAGQGIIEFAALLPVFLMFLLGMLEFGTVFNHNISIEYATREASAKVPRSVMAAASWAVASVAVAYAATVDPRSFRPSNACSRPPAPRS